MIDIHSHIIPNVDDGSSSMDASIKMLEEEAMNGVSDVILTPHYRKGMFETDVKSIVLSFFSLEEERKRRQIDINLHLGQEIHVRRIESLDRIINRLNNKMSLTIGNTKYVLLEFSYTSEIDISEVAFVMKKHGYIPIIAHIERYVYLDIEKVMEIKEAGAMIQVNASSIVGEDSRRVQKFIFKLIKLGLVDYIGSDIHQTRINYISKAKKVLEKKFDKEIVNDILINNPHEIIKEYNEQNANDYLKSLIKDESKNE